MTLIPLSPPRSRPSARPRARPPPLQLYIGNLVPGAVTDVALRQLFNATLLAAFPPSAPGEPDPVSNVNLHSEGRYAFVEFRSPEMATAALALNNQVGTRGRGQGARGGGGG